MHVTAAGKGTGNNISADEYLYRDARNREIRMQQRVIEAQQELQSEVNAKKINPKSAQLLKKRAVKLCLIVSLMAAFLWFRHNTGTGN